MTTEPLNWELCRSFLAVLREGNLSRAARALQLTQPTLGRHIDEMESALGVSLFTRSPQGLAPTEAAFELKPHAEAMASAADALVRAASGGSAEARGTVRVTVPELVGAELMPRILMAFHAKHPAIDIELVLTNVTENLLQREADIAVRMVRPTQNALVARNVGQVRFGLYAHKDYLTRCGTPRSMADLRDHTLIGFDRGAAAIRALRDIPNPISRESFAFRSDSPVAQIAMARAGYGIGRGADIVGRRDPDLVPVLADQYCVVIDTWVVMHEDARNTRRTRLMFDHLVESFEHLIRPSGKQRKKA
jgi:DNA-binding transcriptional LysR family regulator